MNWEVRKGIIPNLLANMLLLVLRKKGTPYNSHFGDCNFNGGTWNTVPLAYAVARGCFPVLKY
jgi:hypothetical protein